MPGFGVIVRDGRVGRDPALVTDEGGEVLDTFESERPIEMGEQLTLPNGDVVIVIGTGWRGMPGESLVQTVAVGNL